MKNLEFVKVNSQKDLENSLIIINKSFITVADDFGLTKENSPTNPAFINIDSLKSLILKTDDLFLLKHNTKPVGFYALENSGDNIVYYLERLSILPDYRHNGLGEKLLDHAFDEVKNRDGKKISIGIIDNNIKLKNWYIRYGFKENLIKKYDHLPFDVCFMSKEV